SEHAMLRLIIGIRAIRVRGRLQNLGTQLAMLGSLGEDRLPNQQRRRRLMAAIVIGAPEWRLTIELLDHRQQHPLGIVRRRRIATSVIGEINRLTLLETLEESPEDAFCAFVEQPAEAQQHMP